MKRTKRAFPIFTPAKKKYFGYKLWAQAYLKVLSFLPLHVLSHIGGRFAQIQWPRAFVQLQIRLFGSMTGVCWEEVDRPLTAFSTLQEFFTRPLKEGTHPVDPALESIVFPCDGYLGESGLITQGCLMQIKERPYSLEKLVGDKEWAQQLEGGFYANLYLSPKDYHRFHAPCCIRLCEMIYTPGFLLPVNPLAVRHVQDLFCGNERAAMRFELLDRPGLYMVFVAIGATMVGQIRLPFELLGVENRSSSAPIRYSYGNKGMEFQKGDYVGHFELGSCVVMLFPPGIGSVPKREGNGRIRMGERVCLLNNKEV